MNELNVIKHPEFGSIRTEVVRGEVRFVAKDVCTALGIEYHRNAIQGLDDDERAWVIVDTPGGKQRMVSVTESGLYVLIFQSRKPNARAFRRWVTGEVLPSIRRTGFYGMNRKELKDGRESVDVMRMLSVIDGFLMPGDKKRTAERIGVSQVSINNVIKGHSRSPRILSALYDQAMENGRRLNGNLYMSPERAIERLINPGRK
jgi:prophage antirepressor-like protein